MFLSDYPPSMKGLLAAAGMAMLMGCDAKNQETVAPRPSVGVVEVIAKEVSLWDEFSARIAAVESVDLRPRVSGYIESLNFAEGSEVNKGDVLFTIDDRNYRAELARANAELTRTRTQAALTQSEARRAERLVQSNAISVEAWEQRRAAAEQGQSAVQAAQAAVDQARLNLEWTRVRAPISGRAGRALVTAGNLVTAGDMASVLTTLVSQDKAYVYFDVDEPTFRRYDEMARSGQHASRDASALPVRVALVGENGFPHEGRVDFTDNQMARSTGTITMRAVLDNAERRFRPGLFARVRLLGSMPFTAILVDDRAILTDQDRKFVYVVDQDAKARRRDVQLGRTSEGLRVVQRGLQAGERVIVNGTQKITVPGTSVDPQPVETSSTSATPTVTAQN